MLFRKYPLVSLCLTLLLFGCGIMGRKGKNEVQVIIPESAGLSLQNNESTETAFAGYSAEAVDIIGPRYRILGNQVLDIDNNQDFEDIYFVRSNESGEQVSELFLFDIDNDRYRLKSKVTTGFDNTASLVVSVDDVNGDSHAELICQGFSTSGEQILDIYRINMQDNGLTPLLNLVVKGSVEIRTGESYIDETQSATGSAILVHRDNPETPEDPIDLIREVYLWQPLTRTYQISRSSIIQSETVAREKIQSIYYGDETVFGQFLKGSWLKIDSNSGYRLETIHFSPGEKAIFYYNGEIMETYDWDRSRKLVHNRLYIESENTLIGSLKCSFYISAETYDKIYVSLNGTFSDLNGTYARVNIPLDQFKNGGSSTLTGKLPTDQIEGLYKGNLGFDLLFQFPKVTIMNGTDPSNVVGIIYPIHDIIVLEWQFPDKKKKIEGIYPVYQLKYSEREESNHIIRSLIMEPVELHANRYIPINAPPVHLEKIEPITDGTSE